MDEATSEHAATALLTLSGVGKTFGGTRALDGIDLSVAAGRVHALVGENGAGKSTLVKIVSGLVQPDEGTIKLDGTPVRFAGPAAASAAGIHIVHQELALLPLGDAAENVFLGHEPHGRLGVDRRAMRARADAVLRDLGVEIDMRRPVGELSTAQQQMIEIARAILRDFRVIILDEPTAALPPAETERLFAVLRRLAARGTAVIYISHRLDEIEALADEITVLKDGQVVDTRPAAELDAAAMIRMMVGRTIENLFPPKPWPRSDAPVALAVSGLSDPPRVLDVSLEARAGEVVGIYGLEGGGQDEVLACLAGARRPVRGALKRSGRSVPWSSVAGMVEQGLGFVPEDRKSEGLVLGMSGHANVTLPILRRLSRRSVVMREREAELSGRAAEEAGVRGDVGAPVRSLSGGNQQKILLARWLAAGTEVFLLNQPTRGVDVGSKSEIYALIRARCAAGATAIVVAREITELQGLCDRILVMAHGRIVAECSPEDDEETILAAAVGQPREAAS